MKIYIVFWSGSFDEWRVVKVFSDEEKANNFIKDKSKSYWILEEVIE